MVSWTIVKEQQENDNIAILGVQGFLIDGIKFLIKIIRPQNIKIKRIIFWDLVIFIKNIDPIKYQEALRIQSNVLPWGHHDKFNKIMRPWSCQYLFQKGHFSTFTLLLYTQVFCFRFHLFLRKLYSYIKTKCSHKSGLTVAVWLVWFWLYQFWAVFLKETWN